MQESARCRGRARISAMAMVPPLLCAVVLVLRSGFMGPMFAHPDPGPGTLLLVVAGIGILAGEVWIHRILTSVGNVGETTWRYHR